MNDASALVALRIAVGATAAGVFSIWEAGFQFVLVSVGGIALGLLGGIIVIRVHNWLDRRQLVDAKLTITMTLLTPYAVYLPAEHLHVSGVLAAVTAGLWVGSRCERVFSEELYQEARAVWEWVEFLLNSLIFILIGLMLKAVLEGLDNRYSPIDLLFYAVGISGVVIVSRILWMYPGAYLPRWADKNLLGLPTSYPPWQWVTTVAWTGMRGVVSLAAAMSLPMTMENGKPFPHRDLIQFLTFWVIFATLVGQGLTLPLVIRLLGVSKATEEPSEEQFDRSATCSPVDSASDAER